MTTQNASMNITNAVTEFLLLAGVRHVFGYPGETSLPLYVSLQRRPEIMHILARCPRCAATMADAYARISGRVGVCDAPGGIGSPFAAPALLEARNSSVPLLFLASGTPPLKNGSAATGQCDQQALFAPVTKATYRVEDEEGVGPCLDEAIRSAASPRLGPVFVEIAANAKLAGARTTRVLQGGPTSVVYPASRSADSSQINRLHEALAPARSLAVLAGGGVHLAHAIPQLLKYAEGARVPVATTLNGKGAIPEGHPLALGVVGAKGHLLAEQRFREFGTVLVLGSKLGDKTCSYGGLFNPRQRVIHVDSDLAVLRQPTELYVPIRADLRLALDGITSGIAAQDVQEGDRPPLPPFWPAGPTATLCEQLSSCIPEGGVLVADASVASGWAGAAIRLLRPNQRLLTPRGSGSLGFALPAAIGASLARPDAAVVALGGDGGFAISMHEMETAVRYRLPILFLLLNNGRLGLIDQHACHTFGGMPVSKDFIDVDWARTAEGFGWNARTIRSPAELEGGMLRDLIRPTGPTLIDYRIPVDEDAPDFIQARRRGASSSRDLTD